MTRSHLRPPACVDNRTPSTITTTTATTSATTSATGGRSGPVVEGELSLAAVDDNSVTLTWQPPPPSAASSHSAVTHQLSWWRVVEQDDVTMTSSWSKMAVSGRPGSENVTLTVRRLSAGTRYCFTVNY